MLLRCFIKSYVPTIIQFQTRQSCIVQCLRSFSVVVVFDGCGDGVAVVGKGIVLMYRIINNICPDYLKNYVSYTSDISCRHTRSTNCNQLYTPKPNCELFRKSFMYSGAAIWNSLLLHVKIATIKILVLLLPIWFCICIDLINDSVFLLI